jgi:hemerythrin-like metal-binding protein
VDAFKWDCPQLVGVAPLDEQHRLIHKLIMGLLGALETGPAGPEAEKAFIRIFESTVVHFRTEEDYLEAQGYPELVSHQFEHELLLDWFRDQMAQREPQHPPPPLAQRVQEIAGIIQAHQATVDQDYAAWLRQR